MRDAAARVLIVNSVPSDHIHDLIDRQPFSHHFQGSGGAYLNASTAVLTFRPQNTPCTTGDHLSSLWARTGAGITQDAAVLIEGKTRLQPAL